MYTLDNEGTFRVEQPSETYIYQIEPVADGLAAISSDNCLRLLDPLVLSGPVLHSIPHIHQEVTSLKALDEGASIVCTAGRDGLVNIFDFRQRSKVVEMRTGRPLPLTLLYSITLFDPSKSDLPS
jgi:SEL1 protein